MATTKDFRIRLELQFKDSLTDLESFKKKVIDGLDDVSKAVQSQNIDERKERQKTTAESIKSVEKMAAEAKKAGAEAQKAFSGFGKETQKAFGDVEKASKELGNAVIKEQQATGKQRIKLTKARIEAEIKLEKAKLTKEKSIFDDRLKAVKGNVDKELKLKSQAQAKELAGLKKVAAAQKRLERASKPTEGFGPINRGNIELGENFTTILEGIKKGDLAGVFAVGGGVKGGVIGTILDLGVDALKIVDELIQRSAALNDQFQVLANEINLDPASVQFERIRTQIELIVPPLGKTREDIIALSRTVASFESPENIAKTTEGILALSRIDANTPIEKIAAGVGRLSQAFEGLGNATELATNILAVTGSALRGNIEDPLNEVSTEIGNVISKTRQLGLGLEQGAKVASAAFLQLVRSGNQVSEATSDAEALFEQFSTALVDPALQKALTEVLPEGINRFDIGIDKANVDVVKFIEFVQKGGEVGIKLADALGGTADPALRKLQANFQQTGKTIGDFIDKFDGIENAAFKLGQAATGANQRIKELSAARVDDALIEFGERFADGANLADEAMIGLLGTIATADFSNIPLLGGLLDGIRDLFFDSNKEAERAFKKFNEVQDVTKLFTEFNDQLSLIQDGEQFIDNVSNSMEVLKGLGEGTAFQIQRLVDAADAGSPKNIEAIKDQLQIIESLQAAKTVEALTEAIEASALALDDLAEAGTDFSQGFFQQLGFDVLDFVTGPLDGLLNLFTGQEFDFGDAFRKEGTTITEEIGNIESEIQGLQAEFAGAAKGSERRLELAQQLEESSKRLNEGISIRAKQTSEAVRFATKELEAIEAAAKAGDSIIDVDLQREAILERITDQLKFQPDILEDVLGQLDAVISGEQDITDEKSLQNAVGEDGVGIQSETVDLVDQQTQAAAALGVTEKENLEQKIQALRAEEQQNLVLIAQLETQLVAIDALIAGAEDEEAQIKRVAKAQLEINNILADRKKAEETGETTIKTVSAVEAVKGGRFEDARKAVSDQIDALKGLNKGINSTISGLNKSNKSGGRANKAKEKQDRERIKAEKDALKEQERLAKEAAARQKKIDDAREALADSQAKQQADTIRLKAELEAKERKLILDRLEAEQALIANIKDVTDQIQAQLGDEFTNIINRVVDIQKERSTFSEGVLIDDTRAQVRQEQLGKKLTRQVDKLRTDLEATGQDIQNFADSIKVEGDVQKGKVGEPLDPRVIIGEKIASIATEVKDTGDAFGGVTISIQSLEDAILKFDKEVLSLRGLKDLVKSLQSRNPDTAQVIPGAADGGFVKNSGLAIIHKGEMVIPASEVDRIPKFVDGQNNTSITKLIELFKAVTEATGKEAKTASRSIPEITSLIDKIEETNVSVAAAIRLAFQGPNSVFGRGNEKVLESATELLRVAKIQKSNLAKQGKAQQGQPTADTKRDDQAELEKTRKIAKADAQLEVQRLKRLKEIEQANEETAQQKKQDLAVEGQRLLDLEANTKQLLEEADKAQKSGIGVAGILTVEGIATNLEKLLELEAELETVSGLFGEARAESDKFGRADSFIEATQALNELGLSSDQVTARLKDAGPKIAAEIAKLSGTINETTAELNKLNEATGGTEAEIKKNNAAIVELENELDELNTRREQISALGEVFNDVRENVLRFKTSLEVEEERGGLERIRAVTEEIANAQSKVASVIETIRDRESTRFQEGLSQSEQLEMQFRGEEAALLGMALATEDLIRQQRVEIEILEDLQAASGLTEEETEELKKLTRSNADLARQLDKVNRARKKSAEQKEPAVDAQETKEAIEGLTKIAELFDLITNAIIQTINATDNVSKAFQEFGAAGGVAAGFEAAGDLTQQVGQALIKSGNPDLAAAGAALLGIAIITKAIGKIIQLFAQKRESAVDIAEREALVESQLIELAETRIDLAERLGELNDKNLDQAKEQVKIIKQQVEQLTKKLGLEGLSAKEITDQIEGLTEQQQELVATGADLERLTGGSRRQIGEGLRELGFSSKGGNKAALERAKDSVEADLIDIGQDIENANVLLDLQLQLQEAINNIIEENVELNELQIALGESEIKNLKDIERIRRRVLASALEDLFALGDTSNLSNEAFKDLLLSLTKTGDFPPRLVELANAWLGATDAVSEFGATIKTEFQEAQKSLLVLQRDLGKITIRQFTNRTVEIIEKQLKAANGVVDALKAEGAGRKRLINAQIASLELEKELRDVLIEQTTTRIARFGTRRDIIEARKELGKLTEEEANEKILNLFQKELDELKEQERILKENGGTGQEILDNLLAQLQVQQEINGEMEESSGILSELLIKNQRLIEEGRAAAKAGEDPAAIKAAIAENRNQIVADLTEQGKSPSEIQAFLDTLPTFQRGGLVTTTGPAMLHGSPSKPELVVDANTTEKLMKLFDTANTSQARIVGQDFREQQANQFNKKVEVTVNLTMNNDIASDNPQELVNLFAQTFRRDVIKVVNDAVESGNIDPNRN